MQLGSVLKESCPSVINVRNHCLCYVTCILGLALASVCLQSRSSACTACPMMTEHLSSCYIAAYLRASLSADSCSSLALNTSTDCLSSRICFW